MRSLLWCLLMATTLSRDTLTGGDAASLTGRIPDGGGVPAQATGTYARDNNLGTPGTDEIAISAGVGIALGPDGARYGLGGIPSLPTNYRTIAEFLFPDRASGTNCDGLTPGTGEDPGSADFSTGQWGLRLTGHFASPFDFPDARAIAGWLYTDPGIPEGYSIKLERDRDLIGFPDEVHCYVITDAFGNGNVVEVGDVGVDTDFTLELHVFRFGTRTLLCSYLNGILVDSRIIIGLPDDPIVSAGSVDDVVTALEVFQLTGFPGGLGAVAYATQEVMVKWDKDTSTGYLLRTEMFEDSDLPTVDYYLEEWSAGVATGLRYTAQLPITYGVPVIASLEYNAGKLHARDTAGALIWDNGSGASFDIAVDVADDTAATVTDHTTGDPGFGGYDGTGLFLTITEHRVEGEGVPCIPSTGGGGGGPGGGGSGSPALQWVEQNGLWNGVQTPSPTSPTQNQPWTLGTPRRTIKKWVEQDGIWNPLPQGNPSVNGDPGTPDGPPLPSCDDPTPWIPVDPAPLTDRLFFVWEMAVNLINATPFTAVVTSLGSWTPGDIATAVSLGGQIISSQGNYPKFFTGGAYDPAKMDAWIASQIPIEAGLNVAGYYGVSVIDDFNWPPAWPPSGVSKSEIARFCAVWKAQFPWQRLTIRGRPRELLGQNWAGLLDSCICQWHTRFGDPTAFRTAELAAAAACNIPAILWSMNFTNGGSGSSGIPGTLAGMSEMDAGEVLDVGSVFTDAATEATGIANHGVGGWKCNRPGQPPILSRSGMVAALTTVRNQLAAL